MPSERADALWRMAATKWAEIEAERPELSPAVRLQQRLLRLILDAGDRIGALPPFGPAPAELASKWHRGLPAFRNEAIPAPAALVDLVPAICTALSEEGAGDPPLHIRDAIAARELDAGSLVRVSLARDRKAIRTSSLHMGFSPDLVWLVGELASCSLAARLQENLRRPEPEEWAKGYCPACGSWPAFIEAREHCRTLRCSYCAFGWMLSSHRCIYCGNEEDDFVTAAADVGRPGRRLDLCVRCGFYTKVVETSAPIPFPLMTVEDLATSHLDEAAAEREYRRPDVIDLDPIDPRRSC